MLKKICVVLVLNLSLIACQSCMTFNFENGFTEYFDNERTVCSNFLLWNVGYYSDITIEPPNDNSTTYVYPNPSMSCASSFEFEVDTAGVLEVNVIVESSSAQDQLVLLVQGVNPGANDVVIGQGNFISTDGNPLSTGGAVHTITITWTVSGTYNAYIALMGLAAEDSIFLIDSLRYVPPTIAEDECVIYNTEETTENVTEENVTPENTEESTTTEETEENITTEETEENTTTEETEENITTEETEETTTTEETEENITTEETEETTTTEETEENITTEETEETTTTEETEENITTEETEETTTTEDTEEMTTTEETEENITTEETEENNTTEETEENNTTDEITTTEVTTIITTTEEIVTEPEETPTTEPTTENAVISSEEEETTESTLELPVTTETNSFWTPLTITGVTLISFIVFCMICWSFYECGKRSVVDEIEPDFDIEDLPKPIIVPRVTKIYYEGSLPGKNMYPV